MAKTVYTLQNIIRALRLPFINASLLPFIAGSLLCRSNFSGLRFFWGCVAAVSTHLSANLINDYADSRSGADWQDRKFYGLFGGSKLIQEGVLSEKFYLKLAIIFGAIAAFSILILALISQSAIIIFYFCGIIFLAWSYSHRPLGFSYRRLGEFIIFILFGPALVMGGYYIQTGIFPAWKSLLVSLPFGFLTTAILYINEIPDFPQDMAAGKRTWVSILGARNAYLGYSVIVALALLSIIFCVALGFLSPLSLVSFAFVFFALKSTRIAKNCYNDKIKLMESSQLTIKLQTVVSIVLILDLLI